jgi:deoxyribonuclease V
MHIRKLHGWDLNITESKKLQEKLALEVNRQKLENPPEIIAGTDCGINLKTNTICLTVVLFKFPSLEQIEMKSHCMALTFPYVPGLLSFRELPVILESFKKLTKTPDVIFVDGQGISHPRRLGLASHLGLWLNVPTIGCAKSILIGKYENLSVKKGNFAYLKDKKEILGAAVRTKDNCLPVIISIGHKIDLKSAVNLTLKCCDGYRIPKPTRIADKLVKTLT